MVFRRRRVLEVGGVGYGFREDVEQVLEGERGFRMVQDEGVGVQLDLNIFVVYDKGLVNALFCFIYLVRIGV